MDQLVQQIETKLAAGVALTPEEAQFIRDGWTGTAVLAAQNEKLELLLESYQADTAKVAASLDSARDSVVQATGSNPGAGYDADSAKAARKELASAVQNAASFSNIAGAALRFAISLWKG